MTKMQRQAHRAHKVPYSRAEFRKMCVKHGVTKKRADELYREAKNAEVWINDVYFVRVHRDAPHAFGNDLPGGMVELSVKRHDQEPIFDWRHIQQIKNDILGPNCEMVQLFPAESRLVDTANQYWFYGFPNDQVAFPFGMWNRSVEEDVGDFGKAKQRAFE